MGIAREKQVRVEALPLSRLRRFRQRPSILDEHELLERKLLPTEVRKHMLEVLGARERHDHPDVVRLGVAQGKRGRQLHQAPMVPDETMMPMLGSLGSAPALVP